MNFFKTLAMVGLVGVGVIAEGLCTDSEDPDLKLRHEKVALNQPSSLPTDKTFDYSMPDGYESEQRIIPTKGASLQINTKYLNGRIITKIVGAKDSRYCITDIRNKKLITIFPNLKIYNSISWKGYSQYNNTMDDTFLYMGKNRFRSDKIINYRNIECLRALGSVNNTPIYILINQKTKLPVKLSTLDDSTFIEYDNFKKINTNSFNFDVPQDFVECSFKELYEKLQKGLLK